MNDIELLQYVHETAEMGIEGLNSLDGQVRDDSLRRVLSQQGAEYRQIADQAERLLRSLGEEPRDPGLLAKVSAEVMSTFKTLADPSASNIAEMVIQGNTMGATTPSPVFSATVSTAALVTPSAVRAWVSRPTMRPTAWRAAGRSPFSSSQ